ncbi:MAG: hypothetical protein RIR73_1805 [Chloroflexota bacterium]
MIEFISKRRLLIFTLAGVFLFICLILLAGLGWTVFRSQEAALTVTSEPETFNYCGAQLTSLCVVSFGRDVFGSTIINLYVPEDAYAPFYLTVIRASGESRYDCLTSKKVGTSVYCTGSAINLGEGFEIQMIAERNDGLMAQGTFILTAYLVANQSTGGEESSEETVTTTVPVPVEGTPVFGEVPPSPTPTATKIPSNSPNYP